MRQWCGGSGGGGGGGGGGAVRTGGATVRGGGATPARQWASGESAHERTITGVGRARRVLHVASRAVPCDAAVRGVRASLRSRGGGVGDRRAERAAGGEVVGGRHVTRSGRAARSGTTRGGERVGAHRVALRVRDSSAGRAVRFVVARAHFRACVCVALPVEHGGKLAVHAPLPVPDSRHDGFKAGRLDPTLRNDVLSST